MNPSRARSRFVLPLGLVLVLAACSPSAEPPRLDGLAPASGVPGTEMRLTGRFYDDVVATVCGLPLEAPRYLGGGRVPATPAALAPGEAYTTLLGLVPEVPLGAVCEVVLVRRGVPVAGATASFGVLASIAVADDAYVAERDVALDIAAPGVLANDASDGVGALVAQLVAEASHGTVVLQPDGSFTYAPTAGYVGADAFTYRATDGVGASDVATVTVDVRQRSDPPVPADDAYATDEDVPLVVAAPGVLANDVDPDGDVIAAVLETSPVAGSVTLNADGSFTYTPNANASGSDAFTYRASDGLETSTVATVTIAVGEVNDPPVAVADALATDRDVPLVVAVADLLANDTDVDGDALSVVSVQDPVNGAVDLAAGEVTFTPTAGFVGPASFGYTVSDGRGGTASATVAVAVNDVPLPPVATDDAFDALGHVLLTVAAPGVLANDSDGNGDALSVVAGSIATAQGGTVSLAADGGFSYVGPVGFTGVDSFSYTVADVGGLEGTATVALTVSGRYWFVDGAAAAGGDGRQGTPFATLAPLAGAGGVGDVDLAGDVVLVRAGTYGGGLELEAGQQLIGQGIAADLTATVNGATVVLLAAGSAPTITTAAGDAVLLATGNTLRGFVAGSAPGAAIVGNAVGTLTVADVRIDNPVGRALDLSTSGTLAASFGTIAATGGTGPGLRLEGLGGTFLADAVTITNPTGTGVAVQSAGGTFTFGATTVTKTTAGIGVDLAGTPTVGFASLAVATSAGTALRVAGGTATVTTGSLAATGGPALDAADATLATTFTSTSSTNGPARGVSLTNVAGTVVLGSGAVSGAATEAFFVSGGGATIAYAGTITNAVGRAASIASRVGGSVTLSGSIADSGTGVLVQNVTGGSVTFSGPSVALSTGANPAVTLTNNGGGTIAFTGGGLALTTVSGAGFTATGGGTVSVTGAANTIATQTGTALNVVNTTIAADGLTFRSVSAGTAGAGPTNAIVLASTGSAGGLSVTGDGGTAGSGGLVQRTTGTAVSLSATHDARLRLMQIVRPGLHGVLATDVTGALVVDRSSIDYLGTAVLGAYALRLENTNTNASLTVDGSRFAGKLDANPALSVSARGTSVLTVAVQDSNQVDAIPSRFTGLYGRAIEVVAGDAPGSSARVVVAVTGSTFDQAAPLGANGVRLVAAQQGVLLPTVSGNVFDRIGLASSAAGVIDVLARELGQVGEAGTPGAIVGNTIVAVAGPGGARGHAGVRVDLENVGGTQTHRVHVAGNTVTDLTSSAAIVVAVGGARAQVVLQSNVFGSPAAPVGTAGDDGVALVVGEGGELDVDVLDERIVAGGASTFAPALWLRSGTASNEGGLLNATVLDSTIAHGNATVDFAPFEMGTRSGTTASACLDLRGNTLDGPTRLFELSHGSSGTFARNATTGGNVVGQVVEFGAFTVAGACRRPAF